MRHFKDKNIKVHSFGEGDYEKAVKLSKRKDINYSLPEGLTEITVEERDVILNPPLTQEQLISNADAALGAQVTKVAQSIGPTGRGFDSTLSGVSYKGGDPNDIDVIYGTALFDYRQAVNAFGKQLLADVLAGNVQAPSIEELIAMLPPWSDFAPVLEE